MSNLFAIKLIILFSLPLAVLIGWLIPKNLTMSLVLVGFLAGFATIQYFGHIALGLLLTTISSAFILPLPGRPFLWEISSLFAFIAVPSAVVFRKWPEYSILILKRNYVLIATTVIYSLFLAYLMHIHGAGLRVMGSTTMGARFYIQQIIMMPLPLCAILFPFKKKTLIRLFMLHLILAFTFVVSEIFLRYGLPGAGIVLQFLDFQTDTFLFARVAIMGGIYRYQSIGTFAFNLAILILVLVPIKDYFTIKRCYIIPVLILLLILCGIGGSRRTVIEFIAILFIMALSQKALGTKEMFLGIAVSIGVIIFLFVAMEHLPLSVQRTFSFLPGIEIDAVAEADANATMQLRRNLRTEALITIENNFWTGMGLDLDPNVFRIYNPAIGTFEEHVLSGRFYSGPLGIFATLGVFPFILFWILHAAIFSLAIRIIKLSRRFNRTDLIHRITFYVTAQYFVRIFLYIFVTGDASNMLKAFIPSATIMILLEYVLYTDAVNHNKNESVNYDQCSTYTG